MRPVSLSISYLLCEPRGISTMALNSSGAFSPSGTSCQRFIGESVAERRFLKRPYAKQSGAPMGAPLTRLLPGLFGSFFLLIHLHLLLYRLPLLFQVVNV